VSPFSVRVEDAGGWRVEILDEAGRPVFERSCSNEEEARTFRSTVEQHLGWLSEEKFRRYYRLPAEDRE
jgi:hypothetical protein